MVAAASAVPEPALRQRLRHLAGRSRCAEAAAQAVTRRNILSSVRAAGALMHPACPPGVLRASSEPLLDLTQGVAGPRHGPACWAHRRPPRTRRSLSSDSDADNEFAAATDTLSRCPPAVLAAAVESNAWHPAWIVAHPGCPPAVLAHLTGDPDPLALRVVASNPNCPPKLVKTLAGDPDHAVRQAAASNPSPPPEMFAGLANDSETEARSHTARNPACPPLTLNVLASDPDWSVRCRAAANPNCPPEILDRLTDDSSSMVAAAAGQNPQIRRHRLVSLR